MQVKAFVSAIDHASDFVSEGVTRHYTTKLKSLKHTIQVWIATHAALVTH